MDVFSKNEMAVLRIFVLAILFAPFCVFGGKEITTVEPVITWNLYVTPVVVGVSTALIMIFINRLFKRQDSKDVEIEKLLAEKEELKEQNIQQWRKTYTDTQCLIKNSVERIEDSLNGKVDKDDCIRQSEDQWDAINELRKA